MLYTNLLNVVQRFRNSQIGITECPYKDTLRLESKNEIDELLRAPLDYCIPSVSVDSEVVNCTDAKGQPNHILIMHIFPSPQVHANQADEVYICALVTNPRNSTSTNVFSFCFPKALAFLKIRLFQTPQLMISTSILLLRTQRKSGTVDLRWTIYVAIRISSSRTMELSK